MTAIAKKVLVALSGGVDSSVCVHLLKKQGFEVIAVVMRMSDAHGDTVDAAYEAANAQNVPLHVLDMRAEFDNNVVKYFVDQYQNGKTPNPCIICNPLVKFAALLDLADTLGCDFIATGHYARLKKTPDKTYLVRGDCKKRDQSYMLYRIPQAVLSRLIFPLCDLEKDAVRAIAAELSLACATKPDSQEICFIPDNDYAGYITRRVGASKCGEFIAPDGKVCGTHIGIINYTVGQRKGLGIALGRPVFVREIDPVSNRIYLADQGDDVKSEATIVDIVAADEFTQSFHADVKIRSTAALCGATITMIDKNTATVVFDAPLRAVAKGQSIVLYDGDTVLGGGFIA